MDFLRLHSNHKNKTMKATETTDQDLFTVRCIDARSRRNFYLRRKEMGEKHGGPQSSPSSAGGGYVLKLQTKIAHQGLHGDP